MECDRMLTRREREIAALVARGASNKEIARELHLCHQTVRNMLTHVYAKTKTRSRTELAVALVSGEMRGETRVVSARPLTRDVPLFSRRAEWE
jgi:DNA-binding NarL/FixJ family response regulator